MSDMVTLSIWFPVGRANFYSYSANGWLLHDHDIAYSDRVGNSDYLPRLQVSVLRRVLEVCHRSFGYDQVAKCDFVPDDDDESPAQDPDADGESAGQDGSSGVRSARPVGVTLTLRLTSRGLPVRDCPERRANEKLYEAGVELVTLDVTEDGFYVLKAEAGTDPDAVTEALKEHMRELFGGRFRIQWQLGIDPDRMAVPSNVSEQPVATDPRGGVRAGARRSRRPVDRGKPVRKGDRYEAPAAVYNGMDTKQPLGIFTFFQLNTLFEGLFNDALTPAVFFEQRDKIRKYLRDDDGAPGAGPVGADGKPATDAASTTVAAAGAVPRRKPKKFMWTVADVVETLFMERDATVREGKMVTLRHFLAVTSRESLQKLKWSVESVRRGLLDEMMGILHRQSTLVQVKMDKLGDHEWAPELATGANESQLRGYVMLAGAKLPLIVNVHRHADSTAHFLLRGQEKSQSQDVHDLRYRVTEWNGLVSAIRESVKGLEKSVEHAWMERLLYEQEQVRAEQEAMAEIQRVRTGRPGSGGGSAGRPYNAVMLFVTIVAAVAAVAAVGPVTSNNPWSQFPPSREVLAALLPAGVVMLALVVFVVLGQRWSDVWASRRRSDSVGYEFAFRLDQNVKTDAIQHDLSVTWPGRWVLRREDRREMRDKYRDARRRQEENSRKAANQPPSAESQDVPASDAQEPADTAGQPTDQASAETVRRSAADGDGPAWRPLPAEVYKPLSGMKLEREGGARIEYASRDSTVVKVHSTVSFRMARLPLGYFQRRARFEVINEFLARQVSEQPQFYLRETRVFGDAPRALRSVEMFSMLVFVLERAALAYQKSPEDDEANRDQLTAERVLAQAGMLFLADGRPRRRLARLFRPSVARPGRRGGPGTTGSER